MSTCTSHNIRKQQKKHITKHFTSKFSRKHFMTASRGSAMAQGDSELWKLYLPRYYDEVDDYHAFSLKCFHEFFKSYQPPPGGAKLLEFGGGPVVSNLISAAPKCREIVFGEFEEDNREGINLWLRKDPLAFNWQPFFSYVVGTLEGGTEENIEERKELLRNTVKTVVPFDVFQADPVKDKGPYDIVTSSLCLEYIGVTKEQYMESIAKVAHLVKPGGILLMQAHENVHSWTHAGRTIKLNPISREFLREVLESAGLSQIRMECLPLESMKAEDLESVPGFTNLMFVVATNVA